MDERHDVTARVAALRRFNNRGDAGMVDTIESDALDYGGHAHPNGTHDGDHGARAERSVVPAKPSPSVGTPVYVRQREIRDKADATAKSPVLSRTQAGRRRWGRWMDLLFRHDDGRWLFGKRLGRVECLGESSEIQMSDLT